MISHSFRGRKFRTGRRVHGADVCHRWPSRRRNSRHGHFVVRHRRAHDVLKEGARHRSTIAKPRRDAAVQGTRATNTTTEILTSHLVASTSRGAARGEGQASGRDGRASSKTRSRRDPLRKFPLRRCLVRGGVVVGGRPRLRWAGRLAAPNVGYDYDRRIIAKAFVRVCRDWSIESVRLPWRR